MGAGDVCEFEEQQDIGLQHTARLVAAATEAFSW
jgi:hypothetical protein